MIAIIGATGNTGRAVVKEFRALGVEPLCIVRNAEKARDVLGADAKVALARGHRPNRSRSTTTTGGTLRA